MHLSRDILFAVSITGTVACYRFRSLLRGQGVFEMERAIQASERRLLQISVDLLNRMAEIQKLRVAIRSTEASKRRKGLPTRRRPDPKIIAPSAGNQLRA